MFYETLIIIMKKNIWLWALAGLFMVSCSSNDDEPNIEKPVTEDDWEGPNGQVVIQLGGGESTATANTTVTRIPITEDTFIDTEVGVFALATTPGADTPATDWSTEGALLSNVQGIISEQTNPEGSETGAKKISLYKNGAPGAVYYYPMDNKYDYTFYGYAPFQETATVTASQATVQFNDFDGSQDIMWNKAAAPQIPERSIYIDEDTDEKNSTVITGYKAKYIRQLKYNHDIITKHSKDDGNDYKWVPNIEFNHLLTQFTFQVVAAKKQSTEDKENVKKMKVKDIKIKNHGSKATLDIISGVLTWTGSEDITMLKKGSNDIATEGSNPSTDPDGGETVGYLMAKPTDGTTPLELEVTIEAPTASGTAIPTEQTVPVFINTTGGFKPGVIYNVQIGIYAMQEVQADATLTEWEEFGDSIEAPVE